MADVRAIAGHIGLSGPGRCFRAAAIAALLAGPLGAQPAPAAEGCLMSSTTRRAVVELTNAAKQLSERELSYIFGQTGCDRGYGTLAEQLGRCSCERGFLCRTAGWLVQRGKVDRYGKLALACHL